MQASNCNAPRIPRSKVKSGCRTCKIRKVKCDEGFPTCHRCVSTGRVCDGYGIWSSGWNIRQHRQRPVSNSGVVIPRPQYISFLVASTEEKESFDWFKRRTMVKLPGSYITGFWSTLLLQASLSERAVFHAVLALSFVHRGDILNSDRQGRCNNIPDKSEQLTLQHYVKAINHLRPHFSARTKSSIRVALIACIVFVALDLLRGHFTTAQIHLENGLRLLGEAHSILDKKDGSSLAHSYDEDGDQWIVETFSRLFFQVELLKQPHQQPCLFLYLAAPAFSLPMFSSFREAWQGIERLLHMIFDLSKQAREQEAEGERICQIPSLLDYQQQIRLGLAQWLEIYEASEKALRGSHSMDEERVYHIIMAHHSMMAIMGETCLHPGDEEAFDSQTIHFERMIRQLADVRAVGTGVFPPELRPIPFMNMSRSIIDMAWIPPLYYIAIKCRVHRIRLQAVLLLESTYHREGIWDARIMARVSRKVMEIEEGDYYDNLYTVDDFPLSSYPTPQDLLLPLLPVSFRIRDAEVMLSGSPLNTVSLLCRQRHEGMDRKMTLGEWHVASQCWKNVNIG